jgi:hypothetical protein
MALVLLNGLQDAVPAVELRYLLTAIRELGFDHINILRTAFDPDNNWYVVAPPGEIGLALLNELTTRHLVGERAGTDEDASALYEHHPDEWYEKRLPPFARKANLKPFEKPDARRMVRLTELGERLLNLVRDPSAPENG